MFARMRERSPSRSSLSKLKTFLAWRLGWNLLLYLLIVFANGIFWNLNELLMRMKVEEKISLNKRIKASKDFRNCYGSEDIFLAPHTFALLLSFYYQIEPTVWNIAEKSLTIC